MTQKAAITHNYQCHAASNKVITMHPFHLYHKTLHLKGTLTLKDEAQSMTLYKHNTSTKAAKNTCSKCRDKLYQYSKTNNQHNLFRCSCPCSGEVPESCGHYGK